MSARRVLTVDDSRTMRNMVAFTLRNAGYAVEEAQDGAEAIKALQIGNYDLVITDLNMPTMDGLALVRAMRATPRNRATPILILTTEADADKKAAGRAAGATGWLVKPFNPQRLIEITAKVCA